MIDDRLRSLLRRLAEGEMEFLWDEEGGQQLCHLASEQPSEVAETILDELATATIGEGRTAEELFRKPACWPRSGPSGTAPTTPRPRR